MSWLYWPPKSRIRTFWFCIRLSSRFFSEHFDVGFALCADGDVLYRAVDGFLNITDIVERFFRQILDAAAIADIAVGVPMKRLAKPIEVGELFAFLGSDEASYLTGSQVVIDGGSTLPETMSIGTN